MAYDYSKRYTQFKMGRIGAQTYTQIATINMECTSFDVEKVSSSEQKIAAICGDLEGDYLVMLAIKGKSKTQGKQKMFHDFDYVELTTVNSGTTFLFLNDDRRERIDVFTLTGPVTKNLEANLLKTYTCKIKTLQTIVFLIFTSGYLLLDLYQQLTILDIQRAFVYELSE
jgi:hypothetical protein